MAKVKVRYPSGTIQIDDEVLFDSITSGPWRETPQGPRNFDGSKRERAEVEYD